MDDATILKLLEELGVDDPETDVLNALKEAATDTEWETAANTPGSVFWQLVEDLFVAMADKRHKERQALVPNMFSGSSSGAWADQWGSNVDLERSSGTKAKVKLKMTLTGAIDIKAKTRFYLDQQKVLNFIVDADYSAPDGSIELFIQAEAEQVGTAYNLIGGTVLQAEDFFETLTKIEIDTTLVSGDEPEADPDFVGRIVAKEQSADFVYGVRERYLMAIEAASAEIKSATFDEVDLDHDLKFTAYGAAGPVSGDAVTAGQAALDAVMMDGEIGVLASASPQNLDLTIKIQAAYIEAEVTTVIGVYFAQEQAKDQGFVASLLSDYLYSEFSTWAGQGIVITPQQAALTSGTYINPILSYDPWS